MVKCISKGVFGVVWNHDIDKSDQVESFVEDSPGCPSYETVHNFFTKIFTSKNLSAECAVTAAAYVDRLDYVSNIKLNHFNWRRVCFICILEADKVLRDKLVWNEDYKDLLPAIDLFELRKLERNFLKYIQFNLTLTQSDYARYYFDLLSLRDSSDIQTQQQLPLVTQQTEVMSTKTTTIEGGSAVLVVTNSNTTPKSARKSSWLQEVEKKEENKEENKQEKK
eukprot:TRINITY_DN1110_c0_g1_i1.p1 TRINITY_DN1110_c0_g1~~TRINITY_DN1110_c0_g1_i1.p1  ORF type:complete len:223 (+),score=46.98 TRINITY_DN1110_c0_g1_i1:277-945(+)